ncbi:MAG TPA: hypothetical protein PLI47_08065 [Bacteroidia bacterium]|jgi:hypothetical protein|nr:hypothetical protein [Bacteroidia bacterium]HQW23240.1 hypothetical protein [Bacteroidia bacterium]
MKTLIYNFAILAAIVLMGKFVNGQGCSDAGFCTLNSFKPNSSDSVSVIKNQFKVGFTYGSADYSISIFGNYLEYNRQLNDKFTFDAKITSLAQSGNDISEIGLSDIYLNVNYKIFEKAKISIGTKIPLADGNKTLSDLSLPMDYQSSLGTFDIIIGVGFEVKKLQCVAAIQQPVTQNKNEFLSEKYPADSELRNFQSTNKYKRSGDVLFRVSYPIMLGDKFKITPSILPIYHLQDDKYTDVSGVERMIDGSQGLTLNGNAFFDYEINKKNALQLNVGAPFVVRDARPDGLTRGLVINFEYRIKF